MSIKNCIENGKNDIGAVLLRTSKLREGKSQAEMSQRDGMIQSWKELKEFKRN